MKQAMIFLLIVAVIGFSAGCAESDELLSKDIKMTPISADWPWYATVESLTERATHIFEGVVVDVFFDVIDSAHPSRAERTEDPQSNFLYTVYQIEVTCAYQGDVSATEYICVMGGVGNLRLSQQKQEMVRAGIYNPNVGIPYLKFHDPLSVGKTYLFSVIHKGGPYKLIVNPVQFALDPNQPSTQSDLSANEIKLYFNSKQEKLGD